MKSFLSPEGDPYDSRVLVSMKHLALSGLQLLSLLVAPAVLQLLHFLRLAAPRASFLWDTEFHQS